MDPTRTQLITLRRFLDRARRDRARLAAIIVLPVVLAGLSTLLMESVYTATTRLLVRPLPLAPASGFLTAPTLNLETESRLIESDAIIGRVEAALGRENLEKEIQVSALTPTELLTVSYSGTSPQASAEVANAVAETYLDYRTEQTREDLNLAARSIRQQIKIVQNRIADVNADVESLRNETRGAQSRQATKFGLAMLKSSLQQERALADRLLSLETEFRATKLTGLEETVGRVVDPARAEDAESAPRPLRSLVLGLILGLAAAVTYVAVAESLRDPTSAPTA